MKSTGFRKTIARNGKPYVLLPFSVHFSNFPLFLSNEGGNRWTIDKTVGFLWNMQDISGRSTQAMLTRDKESSG